MSESTTNKKMVLDALESQICSVVNALGYCDDESEACLIAEKRLSKDLKDLETAKRICERLL